MSYDQELQKGVENLQKNINRFPSDSCERNVFGVIKHKEVQEAILKLLSQGNYFSHYECRDIGFIPGELFMVILYFRCIPPRICIIHPRLEIIYDRPKDKVVEIRETL